jgi:hypothetical protein
MQFLRITTSVVALFGLMTATVWAGNPCGPCQRTTSQKKSTPKLSSQKAPCSLLGSKCGDKGGGKNGCSIGRCGKCSSCTTGCGTVDITVKIYGCKCTTVCLLGPPSRGLGCGKGGSDKCGSDKCGQKPACAPCAVRQKSDCGKGGCGSCGQKSSLLGNSLFDGLGLSRGSCGKDGECPKGYECDKCRECKSRVKKRLMVKEISIECPVTTCTPADKKGDHKAFPKVKSLAPSAPAEAEPVEASPEAAPADDIPDDPPPVNIGRASSRLRIIRTSHTEGQHRREVVPEALFDTLFE